MNVNRITRITRTTCPNCQTLDDHTVKNWQVSPTGAAIRPHCCKYCGFEWVEWITADLTKHYLAWEIQPYAHARD